MTHKLNGLVMPALLFLAVATGMVTQPWTSAQACSRVFINGNQMAKIVVRSMDLPAALPEKPRLVAFPRGLERDCRRSVLPGVKGTIEGLGRKPLSWTSKYASLVMTAFRAPGDPGLPPRGGGSDRGFRDL